MNNKNLDVILNHFRAVNRVLFLTHKNPDFDGISTCAALAQIAQTFGCEVEITVPDEKIVGFGHLPFKLSAASFEKMPDIIVICDTAVRNRVYLPPELENITRYVIDHHQMGDLTADLMIVDSTSPSCADFLARLLVEQAPELITPEVAQYLLDGTCYDTQFFRISSTNSQTLQVASQLLALGASVDVARRRIYKRLPVNLWRYRFNIMQQASYEQALDFMWLVVREVDITAAIGAVDYPKDLLGGMINEMILTADVAVAAIFFVQASGPVKISFRSHTVNVHELARQMGGGGHILAAGALCNEPVETLVERVKTLLKA